MEKVRIDELERYMGAAAEWRPIHGDLNAENLRLSYYKLDPGNSFLFDDYNCYEDEEEVYYIQQGTVTFETEDGDVEAEAGEVVRFAPGEWKRGTNAGTEPAVALDLVAPAGDVPAHQRECPDCGKRTPQDIEMTEARDLLMTYCEACGTETGRFTE